MGHRLQPIVASVPSYIQDTIHMLLDRNLHQGPHDDNTFLVILDAVGLCSDIPKDDLHTTFRTIEPPPTAHLVQIW